MKGRTTMRIKKALTLAIISIATLGSVTPVAQADADPTVRELLDKCNKGTDLCVFHPESRTEFGGQRKQVGRTVFNCTKVEQRESIAWADATGGSNSVGITIEASMKFAEVYQASVAATYSHTWEWSHTVTRTDILTVPAFNVGQIFHAPEMQTVKGEYELHFGKKFHGHYFWYVKNFSATSPMDNDGSVTFYGRAMTRDERARCPR